MTNETLKDDIGWIKQIAEEGKNTPIKGTVIGVWWGIISFIVMIIHWAVLKSYLPLSIDYIGWVWLGYVVIGNIGTFILIKNLKSVPEFNSINSRLAGATWMLASAGILTFSIGVVIAVFGYDLPYWIFNIILPVALICYGIANGVVATLTNSKAGGFIAVISFISALIMFPFLLSPTVYLIAAFAILLIGTMPAILQALVKK